MQTETPTQNYCRSCRYFVQHFIFIDEKDLQAVNCGHCQKRYLDKKILSPACNYYELKSVIQVLRSKDSPMVMPRKSDI